MCKCIGLPDLLQPKLDHHPRHASQAARCCCLPSVPCLFFCAHNAAVVPYVNRTTIYTEEYLEQTLDNLVKDVIAAETSSTVKLDSQQTLLPFLYTGRQWFVD